MKISRELGVGSWELGAGRTFFSSQNLVLSSRVCTVRIALIRIANSSYLSQAATVASHLQIVRDEKWEMRNAKLGFNRDSVDWEIKVETKCPFRRQAPQAYPDWYGKMSILLNIKIQTTSSIIVDDKSQWQRVEIGKLWDWLMLKG